jgi:hypothetical protein
MRYRDRRRYFAADRRAGRALDILARAADPTVRYTALSTVATCQRTLATYAAAFRHANERDEDGYTLAESHAAAARLATLLANTELALSLRQPHRTAFTEPLAHDPHVAAVLAELARTHRPGGRAVLVQALYPVVVDQVGGQAAEILGAIAVAYYRLHGLPTHFAARLVWPHRFTGEETAR